MRHESATELDACMQQALAHVAARSTGPPVKADWRITINFHPLSLDGRHDVLRRLVDEGVYRSQFETGTSNGGLTASVGGDRWTWERRIFGGAYDDAPPEARPKYGALNVAHSAFGGAPRFGSAHLRLSSGVMARATFCFPDSVFEPQRFGVAAQCDLVGELVASERDLLDRYIEAHVHGQLKLVRDVEALVLDPSFRGTAIAHTAAELSFPTEFHRGLRLRAEVLNAHGDYRGRAAVALGRSIAGTGWLTPRLLGEAAASDTHDPQLLKWLWHVLARFGRPTAAGC